MTQTNKINSILSILILMIILGASAILYLIDLLTSKF